MSWYADFDAELKAMVADVWPDVEDRIYTSVHAVRNNLLNAVTKEGQPGGLPLPAAVLLVGKAMRDDSHGLHNRSYRLPLTIFRISRIVGGDYENEALAQIDLLAEAIERTPHTSYFAPEQGSHDGEEAIGVLTALNEARMNLHVAALTYEPGLLSGEFAT